MGGAPSPAGRSFGRAPKAPARLTCRARAVTRAALGDGCFGERKRYEWQQLFDMAGVVVLGPGVRFDEPPATYAP